MVQLDYGNPAVRREMIATMRYWLEEFGIDGFRMKNGAVQETGYGATICNASSSRFGEATGAPWRQIRMGSRWKR